MESQENPPVERELSDAERDKTLTTAGTLGLLGGVVLFVSLFLTWYKDDVSGLPEATRGRLEQTTYSAFEGLERTDVMLAIVAAAAIVVAATALMPLVRDLGIVGWTLTGIGVAATLLVLYRGSEVPKPKEAFGIETSLQFGWYLALLSSVVVIVGGALALRKRPRRPREEDEYEDEDEGLASEARQG